MAVVGLTTSSGLASPAGNFRRAEAYNLTFTGGARDALNTERTQAVTFATAGKQYGIYLSLYSTITAYTVTVKLQENVASVWTTRTTDTFDFTSVDSSDLFPLLLLTSYAVTTDVSTWRYAISASPSGVFLCGLA